MIMDNYGMLYFGLLRNHAICKWDSYRPFTLENQQVVAKDDTHIQWTDGESWNLVPSVYVFIPFRQIILHLDLEKENFRLFWQNELTTWHLSWMTWRNQIFREEFFHIFPLILMRSFTADSFWVIKFMGTFKKISKKGVNHMICKFIQKNVNDN